MEKTISDDQLLAEIHSLVKTERGVKPPILIRINEVEDRRLFAKLGYSSTFEWLVKDLKYSHPAANRRLQAARLLRAVPAAATKIATGEVNLTTLVQVQQAINAEERRTGQRLAREQKANLVAQIYDKSAAETGRLLAETFPQQTTDEKETITPISGGRYRLKTVLSEEQSKKLERVRELESHVNPYATVAALMEASMDEYLKRHDPLMKKPRAKSKASKASKAEKIPTTGKVAVDENPTKMTERAAAAAMASPREETGSRLIVKPTERSKTISRVLDRAVRQRDGDRCVLINPVTGEPCGSGFQVQVDHIVPRALGGEDTMKNLRCLCRGHNIVMAERVFGVKWMAQFRPSPH